MRARMFSRWLLIGCCLLVSVLLIRGQRSTGTIKELKASPGVSYFQENTEREPWSINVIKIDRSQNDLEFVTTLPRGTVQGLTTLSQHLRGIPKALGSPVAAINGDFYETDNGDPRSLSIVQSEVTSAPSGSAVFWLDETNQPHISPVASRFRASFPAGETIPFGLNQERSSGEAVLYTSRYGPSTRAGAGVDLVLQPATNAPPLPIQVGQTYKMVIQEIRSAANTRLRPGSVVLSMGGGLANQLPPLTTNSIVTLSTTTAPEIRNVRTAISGGPLLVQGGKVQPTNANKSREPHPRSAIGWNDKYFFLVQVDGRQDFSRGMTLAELANYMARIGCDTGMNLDGGGSSELWLEGRIVNRPCYGHERDIANALAVIRKPAAQPAHNAANK